MSVLGSIFKSSPKPPAAPDTANTIRAQKEAQQITQFTPQGNLLFGTIDENGNFVQRESGDALRVVESPFQQQFREGQEEIALGLLGEVSPSLGAFRTAEDVESAVTTQIPGLGDFSADALRLEEETFEAGARRLDPIIEEERRALVQNLADRGIPLSSEAGQRELNRFDQSVGDRRQDLAFGAIEAGRAEQNRLTSLAAALRGQELNEQLALTNLEQQQRAQQFGEIGALGGFAAPFQPLNAPTVDVAGIINQGFANQLGRNRIQAQNLARDQQQAGDLISTGASLFALSDIRLKKNIKPYDTKNGYQRYVFEYNTGNGQKYIGVMAQDLLQTKPEAVKEVDGKYMVDYSMLGFNMEAYNA